MILKTGGSKNGTLVANCRSVDESHVLVYLLSFVRKKSTHVGSSGHALGSHQTIQFVTLKRIQYFWSQGNTCTFNWLSERFDISESC